MSLNIRKPVFGVFDNARLKPTCSVTEISQNAEILCVASLSIINIEDADQTARLRRLVGAFVVELQLP